MLHSPKCMIVCRVFWKYAVKHRSGKVVDKINELLNASSWKGKTIGTKCLVRSVGFSRKYGFILCQGFLEMELQQMGGGLERGRKCLGDRRATIQNSPKHLEYRIGCCYSCQWPGPAWHGYGFWWGFVGMEEWKLD